METSCTCLTAFFSFKENKSLKSRNCLYELWRWTFLQRLKVHHSIYMEKQTSDRQEIEEHLWRKGGIRMNNHTVHLFGSPFCDVTREQTFSLDDFGSDQHAL